MGLERGELGRQYALQCNRRYPCPRLLPGAGDQEHRGEDQVFARTSRSLMSPVLLAIPTRESGRNKASSSSLASEFLVREQFLEGRLLAGENCRQVESCDKKIPLREACYANRTWPRGWLHRRSNHGLGGREWRLG